MRFLRSKKVLKDDDASVIAAYRKTADNSYLGILFDRYSHLVFAVSMNYLKNEDDSKDVVIHVFEKLAIDLKKYEIKNFSSWLYSVTKNHCLKQLSKKPFTVRLDEEYSYFTPEEETENRALTDQLLLHLGDALESLNEEQRTCVKLFYIEERSYKEIEAMTGYTNDKVKSYIQNGKRNLKIYLLKKK